MHLSFSFELIPALILSFSNLAHGHVVQKRQICLEDGYLQNLQSDAVEATPFCSSYLEIPLITRTVRTITPTETSILTIPTTRVGTIRTRGTTTQTVTSTVFAPHAVKRQDVRTTSVHGPPAERFDYVSLASHAKVQNVTSIVNALSSACSCLDVPASTTRFTATAEALTHTLTAFDITSTVVTKSRIFSVTEFATITVVSSTPSSYGATGSSPSVSPAAPTISSTASAVITNSTTAASSGSGALPTNSAPRFFNSTRPADSSQGLPPPTTLGVISTAAVPTNSSVPSDASTVDATTSLLPTTSACLNSTAGAVSKSVSGNASPSSTAFPSNSSAFGATGSVSPSAVSPSATTVPFLDTTSSANAASVSSLSTTPAVNSTADLSIISGLLPTTTAVSNSSGISPILTSSTTASPVELTTTVSNITLITVTIEPIPTISSALTGNGTVSTRSGLLPTITPPFLNSTSPVTSLSGLQSPTFLTTSFAVILPTSANVNGSSAISTSAGILPPATLVNATSLSSVSNPTVGATNATAAAGSTSISGSTSPSILVTSLGTIPSASSAFNATGVFGTSTGSSASSTSRGPELSSGGIVTAVSSVSSSAGPTGIYPNSTSSGIPSAVTSTSATADPTGMTNITVTGHGTTMNTTITFAVPTSTNTFGPSTTAARATCTATSPVVNGGFEIHDGTSSFGWAISLDGENIEMLNEPTSEDTPAHSGERQLLIRTISNTDYVTMMQPVDICPNVTYEFNAWIRTPTLGAGCEAVFVLGETLVGAKFGPTTTTAYEQISGTYGPADRALIEDLVAYVDCSGIGYGADVGELYLDDLSLTALDFTIEQS